MSNALFIMAVCLSLWWHFIVFSLFTLKPISKNTFIRYYPKVTFLGSIISQTGQGFQIGVEGESALGNIPSINLPLQGKALESIKILARKSLYLKSISKKKITFEQDQTLFSKPKIQSLSSAILSRKYLYQSLEELKQATREPPTFEIPHHISYPDWAQKRGVEGELKLLFRVTPEGWVDHVEIDRFSSYPKLDMLGVNEVYQWRFRAVQEQQSKNTWGSVVVKFVLD